jgi:ABC-type transport system involved in multi-copper enzyme maturation permease subunit
MLSAIISREFFSNVLNLRFIVGLILCVIITIACVMVLTHDYQQEMADYNLRINLQDEFLSKYAHANRMGGMITPQKPPEQFRPLIIGIPREANLGSFDDNPLPVLFPPLDFLFIVTIVMSLLAMLFSYDAITRERQRGTLRLIISNSIPRAKILLGKFIGGTASLLIPFILSLLAGALYISINPAIQWDGSTWAVFSLLIAASVTFISLFYLLGLMVSTFSRYSSTSILTCLFLWVLLILVIPNMCPFISAQLYRIPSVNKIERQAYYLTQVERDEFGRKFSREVIEQFRGQYVLLFSEFESLEFGGLWGRCSPANREAVQERAAADPEFKAMINAFRDQIEQAWAEANRIQGEKAAELRKDLNIKAAAQSKFAKNIACLSPYANFVYLATDLTGTGLRSLDYFKQIASEYYYMFNSYLEKKGQQAVEKDPTFDRWESFLDISDRPRFVFKEEPLRDKLDAVLPYWGILVLFNVVFFAAAFAGFMRYDVR